MTSKRSLGSRFHGNDITSVPRTSKRGRGIVSSFGIAGGRGGRGREGCGGALWAFLLVSCRHVLWSGYLVDFYAVTALYEYEIPIDSFRHPVGIFLQQIP